MVGAMIAKGLLQEVDAHLREGERPLTAIRLDSYNGLTNAALAP